jgi:hypothetical protein
MQMNAEISLPQKKQTHAPAWSSSWSHFYATQMCVFIINYRVYL